ncbi:class I SAM-dependent methyltransferase [bacterium SCSIO 12741]|nr:class I SAM-dependent methyltransferase [bacterium SCSIO 12741]
MASFDQAAYDYDREFTHTAVGRMQRDRVWHFLQSSLDGQPMKILELNCGTGEDACYLASLGHEVWATDASESMLELAKKKAENQGVEKNLHFQTWDLTQMNALNEKDFDLVFSNFAGLNCLDENRMISLGEELSHIVKPTGKVLAVYLSTHCLWEQYYLRFKGRGKEAKRRATGEAVEVPVSGKFVTTWYYNPNQLEQQWSSHWQVNRIKPIGLFLPPSYLNPFFEKRKGILNGLNALEKSLGTLDNWSNYADHFLMEWEVKR